MLQRNHENTKCSSETRADKPRERQRSFVGRGFGTITVSLAALIVVGAALATAGSGHRFYQAGGRTTLESETPGEENAAVSSHSALIAPTPAPQEQQRVEAELITITPRGFEPSRITRRAGRVLLAVVNRSELAALTLRLESDDGTVLGRAQLRRDQRNWRFPVTLPAGHFRIVDANRAQVACNFEITP